VIGQGILTGLGGKHGDVASGTGQTKHPLRMQRKVIQWGQFVEETVHMPREREHKTIFLSHAQSDAEAANLFKSWLLLAFDNNVQVFASSDWHSIEMGMNWYETIDRALHDAALGIVLLSETSIKRPWVNYELGALRAGRKKTIPLCIGKVTKAALPSPFNHAQACDYARGEDRLNLLRSIASTFGFPTEWVPKAAVDTAPPLVPGTVAQLSPLVSGHGPALERLLSGADRWTTIIYTCRATFTGEQCIPDGPIKKALWTHVPVDEVQTVCVALNHLLPADLRSSEDDVLHTVICSKRAEELLNHAIAGVKSATSVPSLLNRDLVVVGENNFSNMLLQMLQAYLPWQSGIGRIERQRRKSRPDVYVELVPRLQSPVSPVQKRELHKGGAMIVRFPNPFNVRKQVLILFGCHRAGQFTLEEWLRGEEVREIVDGLANSLNRGQYAVQILVDRTLDHIDRNIQGVAPEAIKNLENSQRFWLTPLSRSEVGETLLVSEECSKPHDIFDLSLLLQLPSQIQSELKDILTVKLGFDDLYWENTECEIGFHITLYEFLTHHRPDPQLLRRLEAITPRLCDALGQLQRDLVECTTVRIRGLELLPTALIAYIDFLDDLMCPTAWLDSVRSSCEQAAVSAGWTAHSDLWNSMRVPFPVHITICRFSRELSETEQSRLSLIANEYRGVELSVFSVQSAVLAVAGQSPYRKVQSVKTLELSTT